MYGVSVIPESKLSLQEMNQLIGTLLLTSGFLDIVDSYSRNVQGENSRYAPMWTPMREAPFGIFAHNFCFILKNL